MKAAEEDQVEIMKLLLESRADMEVANRKGRTAVSFAAAPSMERKTACGTLRLLLQAGAKIDTKDVTGMTAKQWATKEKRESALQMFCEFEGSGGFVDGKFQADSK